MAYKDAEKRRAMGRKCYRKHREAYLAQIAARALVRGRKKQTPKYSRERRLVRKARLDWIIHEIKIKNGCKDCGFNTHPAAIDFDHIDRSLKTKGVAQIDNIRQLVRELKNCEIRCANCHRIKTFENKDYLNANNSQR